MEVIKYDSIGKLYSDVLATSSSMPKGIDYVTLVIDKSDVASALAFFSQHCSPDYVRINDVCFDDTYYVTVNDENQFTISPVFTTEGVCLLNMFSKIFVCEHCDSEILLTNDIRENDVVLYSISK